MVLVFSPGSVQGKIVRELEKHVKVIRHDFTPTEKHVEFVWEDP